MTTYLDIDPQKWAFALSSGVMIVILIYGIVWINTLMKIWHTQFQDPREKMIWFLLVLLVSPLAMPVYLLMSAGRAKTTDAAGDDKPRPGKQAPDARYSPADAGMSDDNKERELARLLQMKKNGILSSEQFDKAKKRLQ